MKQPCKIKNKCQCLAWAAVWFYVWKNSIQEHALCPQPCLGVSEDSMGRNVEFGGKSGANRSLVLLLFWSHRDLQLIWWVAPKLLSSCCLMTVWVPCWDAICGPWVAQKLCCLIHCLLCCVGFRKVSEKIWKRDLNFPRTGKLMKPAEPTIMPKKSLPSPVFVYISPALHCQTGGTWSWEIVFQAASLSCRTWGVKEWSSLIKRSLFEYRCFTDFCFDTN